MTLSASTILDIDFLEKSNCSVSEAGPGQGFNEHHAAWKLDQSGCCICLKAWSGQPPGSCWPVPVSPAVFGMVLLSAGGHRTAPSAPSSRRASGWLLGSRGAEPTLHSSLPQNAAQIPQGPHPFPQHLFMCCVLSVSAPPAMPPPLLPLG